MALEKLTDEQFNSLIDKDGNLYIPYELKKQVKAKLEEQFQLLQKEWDDPNIEGDSALYRKVVLHGINKIYIQDKAGDAKPKFITNVSALLDGRGRLSFADAKKRFQASLRRVQWESAQTLDPKLKSPGSYRRILPRLTKLLTGKAENFGGHIHHRLPLYVLGKILDQWETVMHERAGKEWDGRKYTDYSTQLIRIINKRLKIPTGNDWRNLDWIKKQDIQLHDQVHAVWDNSGLSKKNIVRLLTVPDAIQGKDYTTVNGILELLNTHVKDTLGASQELVDEVLLLAKDKTSGQLGKFVRDASSAKGGKWKSWLTYSSLATGTNILIGGAVDAATNPEVLFQAGQLNNKKLSIFEKAQAQAKLREKALWSAGTGLVTSAAIGKLGAAKYFASPTTAIPFLTWTALEAADAIPEGMGRKGWKQHYANILNYDQVREEGAGYSDRKFVPRESKQEVRKEFAGAVQRIGEERKNNPNNLDSLLNKIGL